MKKYYITGIGSRETPSNIKLDIFNISKILTENNFILRSGGADGADTFFEDAFDFYHGKKEIYIPWLGFNGNHSVLYNTPSKAFDIAKNIHPAWHKLTHGGKKLHARNVLQVLGQDLKTPSDLVVCWTSDGKASGGTATAMNLAKKYNIPVFNLFNKDDQVTLDHYLAWSIFE